MQEVGKFEEGIRIKYFSVGSLFPSVFLFSAEKVAYESSIEMRTASQDGELNCFKLSGSVAWYQKHWNED